MRRTVRGHRHRPIPHRPPRSVSLLADTHRLRCEACARRRFRKCRLQPAAQRAGAREHGEGNGGKAMIAASFTFIWSIWTGLKNIVQGWNRFWFTPADPTLLGFMRICCGLVVLYV